MTEVILHIGSNVGLRQVYLEYAELMILDQVGPIIKKSKVYETAAWGYTEQNDFLNVAYQLTTSLTADKLLQETQRIEQKIGRKKDIRWGPRIIDIDIIFYGDEIIENHNLKIPHPQLSNRRFVLTPLLDICPDKVHPVFSQTIKKLAVNCTDTSEVKVYKN